jgi:hypothetical protein
MATRIISIANPGMREREGDVRFPVLRSRLAFTLSRSIPELKSRLL